MNKNEQTKYDPHDPGNWRDGDDAVGNARLPAASEAIDALRELLTAVQRCACDSSGPAQDRAQAILQGTMDMSVGKKAGIPPLVPTPAMLNAARDWSYVKYGKPIGDDAATGCWIAMLKAAPAAPVEAGAVPLTVWEGSMPESNGKSNFTAVLYRKGDKVFDGPHFTIARSEYPDRVRYEADRVRYLIGEIEKEPFILDYDDEKHSGYVTPPAQPEVQDECSHANEPRGCYRVRCQLGEKCVEPTHPSTTPADHPTRAEREAAQRKRMAERFAGRTGPATADFDLPAGNDAIVPGELDAQGERANEPGKWWKWFAKLPRHSFILTPEGNGVRRVQDKCGGWIDEQKAGEVVEDAEAEINELRSALDCMLTFFGMDEDAENKTVFDQARQALHDIAYTKNLTATPQQFADHLQREARTALSEVARQQGGGDAVDLHQQRLVLWQAIQAIKIGNATDDKLIIANLHAEGYVIARAQRAAVQGDA